MKFINAISFQTRLIRLLVAFISAIALAACGGGGGSTGQPSSGGLINPVALFTSAPAAVVVAVGSAPTYTIGGGTAPYTVSSSNTGVATVTVGVTGFSITGVAAGTALINIVDAVGKSLSTNVTVGTGSAIAALFVTAPSSVVIAASGAASYLVGGGSGAYVASSSNTGIATAAVNGAGLTITGVAAGTAQVSVFDLVGNSVKVNVTVGSGSPSSLYMTAPSAVTVAPAASPTYVIGGGTAPYMVSTSNALVARAVISGTSLTITGVAAGSAQISVFDATGASVSTLVAVSVDVTPALQTTAPSALTMATGTALPYTISGGTAPYTVVSSNTVVSTASLVGGNGLNIAGTTTGSAQVVVFDAAGKSVTVALTVVGAGGSALYTTAPPLGVTIGTTGTGVYTVGGGTPGYTASTSNASVATASVVGSTLTITGVAGGTATVSLRDGAAAAVLIPVTVGSANALFSTAPSTLTIALAAAPTYTISGGSAPYSASSSNVSVVTTGVTGTILTITAVAAGTATVTVLDATGKSVTSNVTVSASAPTPLFTTADTTAVACVTAGYNGCVTIATGATPSYVIGGGTAPYVAVSSNVVVATANIVGTALTIQGLAAGVTTVQITDSLGAKNTISVTVTPLATTPLSVLPSSVTANVGDVLNFSVSGGTPGYSVTVNNTSIATVSTGTVVVSGGAFTATLRNVGTTTAAIVDAAGQTTTLTLTVAAPSTLLRLSPSALMVGEDYTGIVSLSIYGGTGPYLAYTSDLVLSSVSVSGSTLSIGLGSKTTRCVNTVDATLVYIPNGTYDITITVVDTLGASAVNTLTIKDNGKGITVSGC